MLDSRREAVLGLTLLAPPLLRFAKQSVRGAGRRAHASGEPGEVIG